MRQNRIYITGILLLIFLSGKAQKIEELPAVPLQIGYEKTLHLIFPTEVKYYSIGGDYVIGEKVGNCPEIIRLKAAEENFPGETTLSVVTADTKFYSYAISYNAHPVESYVHVGGQAPAPHTLPVGKDRQMFLIFPAGITYVDYGSTNVEVEKAEGVDNILAVKATGEFTEDTNISAVVEGGKFYTFNLHYVPFPKRFSFVIDKEKTQRVAILDERERSSEQKERIRQAISKRIPLDLGLKDKNAGMEFEVGNIFIDGDILLLRMTLTNRTQIGLYDGFHAVLYPGCKDPQEDGGAADRTGYPVHLRLPGGDTCTRKPDIHGGHEQVHHSGQEETRHRDPGEERRPALPVQTEKQVSSGSGGSVQKPAGAENGG